MSIGAYLGIFGKEHLELEDNEEHQKWIKQVKKAALDGIKKQTNKKVQWVEGKEPDQQLNEELGSWSNLVQLQRYAAHIHFTGKPPSMPVENDELETDEYLIRYRNAEEDDLNFIYREMKFKHLITVGNEIYFIPIDFPEPLLIEADDEEELMSIGSSYQLFNELEELNKYLLMVGDYGQLGDQEAWKIYENEEDPWRFVKWTWIVLHWLARESTNKKLCIYCE